MAQHTPGPWIVSRDDPTAIWARGHYIAEAFTDAGANAPLIAAAPEMLAALRLVSGLDIDHRILRIVDAAIAKAEGRS